MMKKDSVVTRDKGCGSGKKGNTGGERVCDGRVWW